MKSDITLHKSVFKQEKDRLNEPVFWVIYLAAAVADIAAATAAAGSVGNAVSAAIAAEDEEKDQDNDPAAAVTTETVVAHRETS